MPEISDIVFIAEKNKQTNQPVYLYDVHYTDSDVLYLTDADEDLVFEGRTYEHKPVEHVDISENIRSVSSKMTLRVGNADRSMQVYLENHDGLRGRKVVTRLVWRNLLSDTDAVQRAVFFVDHARDYDTFVEFELAPKFNLMGTKLPGRFYGRDYCQWKRFKDADCRYAGDETECDRTLDRCEELGNTLQFGAFPSVPTTKVFYG